MNACGTVTMTRCTMPLNDRSTSVANTAMSATLAPAEARAAGTSGDQTGSSRNRRAKRSGVSTLVT
jgi:hypothetical protein